MEGTATGESAGVHPPPALGSEPPDLAALLHTVTTFAVMLGDPAVHRTLQERCRLGLSWAQIDTLRTVAALAPASVREIARTTHRPIPETLTTIRTLADRGFVARRHDRHDRRTLLVTLTPRGQRADRLRQEVLERVAGEITVSWPAADVRAFSELFGRYTDGLGRILGGGATVDAG